MTPVEGKHLLVADALHFRLDLVRVDAVRNLAGKPEQNRAVGIVPAAGQRERSIKVDDDAGGLSQLAARRELVGETAGRAHRPDGVRARRPEADLEQVKCADEHRGKRVIDWDRIVLRDRKWHLDPRRMAVC